MAADYAAIRADNIRRRGEEFDDVGRFIAEQLYSDRTHFIYELLQNAEDVGARRITFELRPDRLIVRHYGGRDFSEADVRAVTDILRGTKSDDPSAIGRFGIGFKSVYAFTASPEIHSGEEHFCIERYILPRSGDPCQLSSNETLFIFPFDKKNVSPVQAAQRISERLRSLDPRTLLFLRYIEEIEWQTDDGSRGVYLRSSVDQQTTPQSRRVTLTTEQYSPNGRERRELDEDWLVFERAVGTPSPDCAPSRFVEVAFRTSRDSDSVGSRIIRVDPASLAAYFSTDVRLPFGFLVQGPFHTTPARDNVLRDDSWNRELVGEVTWLLEDLLLSLKSLRLMTVSALDSLRRDIGSRLVRPDDFFLPFITKLREIFKTQPIFPTVDGKSVLISQAKLARGSELPKLLNPHQLGDILGNSGPIDWLSGEITEERTPELHRFLVGRRRRWQGDADEIEPIVPELEIRPETIVRNLHVPFLAKQTDEWMGGLYAFLSRHKELWSDAKLKPIVRLSNDTHVTPFSADGVPNAYLPGPEPTQFPVVRNGTLTSDEARSFLVGLGLSEPDIIAEVVQIILPTYQRRPLEIDADNHPSHVAKIVRAWELASAKGDKAFQTKVRETTWVHGRKGTGETNWYGTPENVYAPNEYLELFFQENADALFCLEDPPLLSDLVEIGVRMEVAVRFRRPGWDGHVTIRDVDWQHERGLHGFDPDASIDGLDEAVRTPTPERAAYIWNRLLVPNQHLIRGHIQFSTRQNFSNATSRTSYSKLGRVVVENAWLPTREGILCKPSELSLDDLPDEFTRDDRVAAALEMKPAVAGTIARAYNIEVDRLHAILRFAQTHPEDLASFIHKFEKAPDTDDAVNGHEVDYAAELQAQFGRVGDIEKQEDNLPSNGQVPNPELRRSRIQSEIQQGRAEEPERRQRFARVPRRTWEGKNSEVRTFLLNQYRGACQVCHYSFLKRNGRPYFEALYLVSFTQARWIDRPGNAICLCPTCCAKFFHGSVEADDIIEQVREYRVRREGGNSDAALYIRLCDTPTTILYTERHLLDLQEMVNSETGATVIGTR